MDKGVLKDDLLGPAETDGSIRDEDSYNLESNPFQPRRNIPHRQHDGGEQTEEGSYVHGDMPVAIVVADEGE